MHAVRWRGGVAEGCSRFVHKARGSSANLHDQPTTTTATSRPAPQQANRITTTRFDTRMHKTTSNPSKSRGAARARAQPTAVPGEASASRVELELCRVAHVRIRLVRLLLRLLRLPRHTACTSSVHHTIPVCHHSPRQDAAPALARAPAQPPPRSLCSTQQPAHSTHIHQHATHRARRRNTNLNADKSSVPEVEPALAPLAGQQPALLVHIANRHHLIRNAVSTQRRMPPSKDAVNKAAGQQE